MARELATAWIYGALLGVVVAACAEVGPKGIAAATGTSFQKGLSVSGRPASAGRAAASVVADLPAAHDSRVAAPPLAGVEPLRTRLIAAFSGIEHVPDQAELLAFATPEQLRPALWSLWQDASVRQIIRTNALVSLRFFPTPQIRTWFEQLLLDPATLATVHRSLAKAYGFAFGSVAIALLSLQLEHPSPHTRDSAARALAAIADPRPPGLLRQRLGRETEPLVRKTLLKLLESFPGVP